MSKKKKEKNAKTAPVERLIYCGPNIPGGALHQYAVFKGGLPEHLSTLFEKCPALKKLFVPVQDLVKTQKAIATKGTPEHSYYQEVIKTLRGGV